MSASARSRSKAADQQSAQDASFAGRAFNDRFCQNLLLGQRETVWKQYAPNSAI